MFDFDSTHVRKARIEIIPMIDVMMFLLVFFVLISLNVIPSIGVQTNLPKSGSPSSIDPEKPLIITVHKSGRVSVDGNSYDLPELKKYCTNLPSEKNIILKSDAEGVIQDLIRVMDILKDVGIQKVSIATQHDR